MVSKTDRVLPKQISPAGVEEEEEEAEDEPEVGIMEEQSAFEDLMIWGHETVPEEDPFARGMEEWISFAEQVSSNTGIGMGIADRRRFTHTIEKRRVYSDRLVDCGVRAALQAFG